MKRRFLAAIWCFALLVSVLAWKQKKPDAGRIPGSAALTVFPDIPQTQIGGAWTRDLGNRTQILIIVDNYFSISEFDIKSKKFFYTMGGTATLTKSSMTGKIEFHSADKSAVGKDYSWKSRGSEFSLILDRDGKEETWVGVDVGDAPLKGNWRISGRERDGQMVEIKPAARKTVKLLSGSRFQWAAINTETGEFFGTGGGSYTFKDGIYTEQIEFFSRDSSRVGMSLSFNGKVEGKNWHHSGKSSRGELISERWTR